MEAREPRSRGMYCVLERLVALLMVAAAESASVREAMRIRVWG